MREPGPSHSDEPEHQRAASEPPWQRVAGIRARAVFQGEEAAQRELSAQWPLKLPPAKHAVSIGAHSALWLGPDEFLLLAHDALVPPTLGSPHSWVDVSHRQSTFELSGARAEDILSGACALDLHFREFSVGMCARTAFAKAEIVLWRTRADVFQIEVWNSFVPYVAELLQEIARNA